MQSTHIKDSLGVTSTEANLSPALSLVELGVLLRPLHALLVDLDTLDPVKLVRQRDGKQPRTTVGIDEVALDVGVPWRRSGRANGVGDVGEKGGENRVVVLEEGAGDLLKLNVADLLPNRGVVVLDADVGFGRRCAGGILDGAFWPRRERVAEEEGGAALVIADVAVKR